MQRGKMYFLRIQTTREGVCLVSFEYRFGSKFGGVLAFRVVSVSIAFAEHF